MTLKNNQSGFDTLHAMINHAMLVLIIAGALWFSVNCMPEILTACASIK